MAEDVDEFQLFCVIIWKTEQNVHIIINTDLIYYASCSLLH